MIDERREPFERTLRSQIGRRSQRWNIFVQECIIRPALECSHIKKCSLQINGSDDEKHHKVTLQCDVACCLGLVVLHSQNWLSDFCWPHAKKQVVFQAMMRRCYSWWENIQYRLIKRIFHWLLCYFCVLTMLNRFIRFFIVCWLSWSPEVLIGKVCHDLSGHSKKLRQLRSTFKRWGML